MSKASMRHWSAFGWDSKPLMYLRAAQTMNSFGGILWDLHQIVTERVLLSASGKSAGSMNMELTSFTYFGKAKPIW